jgi:hypothetical protein
VAAQRLDVEAVGGRREDEEGHHLRIQGCCVNRV